MITVGPQYDYLNKRNCFVFMCFYKIVYPKISNFGYPVPERTENVQL